MRPLVSLRDAGLTRQLETRLNQRPAWSKLIARNKMAVGVVDLRDPSAPRFAEVNGETMMYAASLPKLAILLATSQALESGRLEETPELLSTMRAMIARSSNEAAASLYETLGFEYIESVLTDPQYDFYDPEEGGGLWVGKPYGKTGERHPDPFAGLSHGANVFQVARFYYQLALGRLVSRDRSSQMLEMLVDPELHHKFVGSLDRIAPRASVYRKSGTWRTWHSDSSLVWGPTWRRYVVVGLIDDPAGEAILRDLIPVVENALTAPR